MGSEFRCFRFTFNNMDGSFRCFCILCGGAVGCNGHEGRVEATDACVRPAADVAEYAWAGLAGVYDRVFESPVVEQVDALSGDKADQVYFGGVARRIRGGEFIYDLVVFKDFIWGKGVDYREVVGVPAGVGGGVAFALWGDGAPGFGAIGASGK
jgi:hypothetical protein